MVFSTSAALLTLVALASSRNINVSNKCNSDADKTSIGRCVRPWLDLWELQRKHESAAADLVFPLVFYARESVLALCDLYMKSRDDCLTDSVLNTCSGDSMISFVQSHMKYFCGEKAVPALSRFDCLTKAVKSNPACREHIRGIPLPNHQASKCLGMPQFFKCIEPEIDRRCGASGLAVMVQAIDAFGCKFADPGSDKSDEIQSSLRKPAAAPATRPKLRSDVVRALEQSNSTEIPINGLSEQSDAEENSSSGAPLTETASRGPGLILMASSAEQGTTPEPDGPVTKLRDLAPKRPTTRGPGLIMLPLDALFDSWRAVAAAGRGSAEFLEDRSQNLTLPPKAATAASANQSHFAAIADSDLSRENPTAAFSVHENRTDIQPVTGDVSLSNLPPNYVEGSGDAEQDNASDSTKSGGLILLPVEGDASVKAVAEGQVGVVHEGSGEEDVGSGEEEVLSSDSDPSHVKITSTIGALEKIAPTTSSPVQPQKTLSPASAANSFCDKEKETAIGNCFLPLSKRWEGINANFPGLSDVIFPLFNYSTSDLLGLCDVLQVTIDDCLSKELLISCSENPLVTFVNSLLGYACAREHHTEFFMNYDCTSMVMHDSQHCFALIPGKSLPGISIAEKCANMPAFYECMETQVAEKCSSEARQSFLKAILNFGCDVAAASKKSKTEKENVDVLPVVDDDRENKVVEAPVALPSTSPTPAVPTSIASTLAVNETEPTTGETSVQTTAPPVNAAANSIDESSPSSSLVTLSPECTTVFRARARECVSPLMETWTRIRKDKPQLNNITFPLYKYQREELLELCDGYANVFLCAGFDPIQKCLTDEMVRFANDHLGYVCSPQNIVNFMRHYDCIMDLVGRNQNSCVPLISGTSQVGQDADKCKGVPNFYSCMKGGIELNCRPTALQEFEGTISQFGCELSS